MRQRTRLLYGAAAVVPFALAASAMGQTSPFAGYGDNANGDSGFTGFGVNGSFGGGEPGPADTLEAIYGGSASQNADGVSYTLDLGGNGSIAFTRVRDAEDNAGSHGSTLDLGSTYGGHGTDATDGIWQDGVVSAHAQARYAGNSQAFSYLSGDSGLDASEFANNSFAITGSGTGATGSATFDIQLSEFRWARANNTDGTGNLMSSNQDDQGGDDHMMTYAVDFSGVTGGEWEGYNSDRPVWLLFWEDLPNGESDFDYNDLVIELSVIPLPAPVAMGLLGLGGVVAFRRRLMK